MATRKKVLVIVGTRPEAIKLAPVIMALRQHPARFETRVGLTGQHEQMLNQALAVFDIQGDFRLRVMAKGQTLAALTAKLLARLDDRLKFEQPDWVLAQGDTTTVMAVAMCCFYRGIRFGHVEAGLRTGSLQNPFPEEANRRIADLLASYYFAPTRQSYLALRREGVPARKIAVTGNTVVDALRHVAHLPFHPSASPLSGLPVQKKIVLVTLHRRESQGAPLRQMCQAIRTLASRMQKENVHFVFPVHLNPDVRETVFTILDGHPSVSLISPLDYQSFVWLMSRSVLIMTDSGGIQEEAPSFHVPVLVLRDKTERSEAVAAGVAKLVGSNPSSIISHATRLLCNETARQGMSCRRNPFGDGQAARRIARVLELAG